MNFYVELFTTDWSTCPLVKTLFASDTVFTHLGFHGSFDISKQTVSISLNWIIISNKDFNNTRDTGVISGQGGQQEWKGTEDLIHQIFIILFPNHVLLIFLGTGFVLIRE